MGFAEDLCFGLRNHIVVLPHLQTPISKYELQ